MQRTGIWVLVAVILAASFVMVANILSDTAISIKNKGVVNVKGFAKQEISSDLGILEARIVAENPDIKACYESLSKDKEKVTAFLRKNFSFAEKDLELKPARIKEVYKINERGHDTDEFVKFILKQGFKIESSDVGKISDISSKLVDVLDEGVKIHIGSPEYIYTGLEELKVEMIGRATNNARERAHKIAKEGKFRLGPISSVRVGIFQITPIHSTRISNYGMNDTSTIDKEIKSVVEIEYFVK